MSLPTPVQMEAMARASVAFAREHGLVLGDAENDTENYHLTPDGSAILSVLLSSLEVIEGAGDAIRVVLRAAARTLAIYDTGGPITSRFCPAVTPQ